MQDPSGISDRQLSPVSNTKISVSGSVPSTDSSSVVEVYRKQACEELEGLAKREAEELLERMQNLTADVQRLQGQWVQDCSYRSWNKVPVPSAFRPTTVDSYRNYKRASQNVARKLLED